MYNKFNRLQKESYKSTQFLKDKHGKHSCPHSSIAITEYKDLLGCDHLDNLSTKFLSFINSLLSMVALHFTNCC
jgi:hypothetical protein